MSASPSTAVFGLGAIRRIAAELIVDRPLSITLQEVTALLVRSLPADHSTIALLDDRGQFFRIEAEHPATSPSLVGERITIAERPTQSALLNSGEPLAVSSRDHLVFTESESFQEVTSRLNIQSLLVVPIISRYGTIGTLSVDSIGRPRTFVPSEVELCQTIASQLALAVENTRLREEQAAHQRQVRLLFPAAIARGNPLSRVEEVSLRLLDKLLQEVEFKKASVQLLADGKRTLVAARGFSKDEVDPWLLRPVDSDPIISRAVAGRKPLVLADTGTVEDWGENRTVDVRSWMAIPLIYGDSAIGIVTLDHDESGFYGRLPQNLLDRVEEIASKGAIEIQNMYELAAAQRQSQALELIGQIAEDLAATLDTSKLLPAMVETIARGLGCTQSSVFFLERQGEQRLLVCEAPFPVSAARLRLQEKSDKTQLSAADCIWAALEQPQCKHNIALVDAGVSAPAAFGSVRSLIAVPLRIANHAIGVILAAHDKPNWFSDADLFLLETAARHAAIAIERSSGLKLIHSIGGEILGTSRAVEGETQGISPPVGLPKTFLERIVTGAMELTHTDSGVIYVLNESATDIIATFAVEGSIHPKPRLENPDGITNWVIQHKRMLPISDITKDARVNPELLPQYHSMFAVPLLWPAPAGSLAGDKVVGVLYLNGKTVRQLTPTEESLLETLAHQAASVIQREQLYQQLVRSEATYHSLVDHIPQYVMRKDFHSRFVYANTRFCESVGRSLRGIVGKSDLDFYSAEDAEKFIRLSARI